MNNDAHVHRRRRRERENIGDGQSRHSPPPQVRENVPIFHSKSERKMSLHYLG